MVQKQISSIALQKTDFVPSLDSEITPNRNLVYCATFQLVWNQLIDEIIRSPIELDGSLQFVQSLNKRLFEKQDISPSCYMAMAGFEQDGIVEKIRNELREKFHREPGFDIQLPMPDAIISYAYLEKSLCFETKFDVYAEPLLFSDGINVQTFGVAKIGMASSQLAVLDYRDSGDFILKFQKLANSDSDEIVLAKVAPKSTLLETVESVLLRTNEKSNVSTTNRSLDITEKVQIPKLGFDVLRQYHEFEGRNILNQGFEGYFIAKALQAIKFQLDETG
jgi:hypothetical protein